MTRRSPVSSWAGVPYWEVGQYSNHTVGRFSVSGLVGGEGRHTVSFAKRSERSMMLNLYFFLDENEVARNVPQVVRLSPC